MDIFGPAWVEYTEKLRRRWDDVVNEKDIVLIPGDISWAIRLSGAMADLKFIDKRPGLKIMTRGNHDYWWSRQATSRIQKSVDGRIVLLQGTSKIVGNIGITGTRGWRRDWAADTREPSAEQQDVSTDQDKIYRRELEQFERGLKSIPDSVETRIAMLHFPPFDEHLQPNEFADLLSKYSVDYLVYGHIHLGLGNWIDGDVNGIRYRMVSADVVDFTPQLIVE